MEPLRFLLYQVPLRTTNQIARATLASILLVVQVFHQIRSKPMRGALCKKAINGQLTKTDVGLACSSCSDEIDRELKDGFLLFLLPWFPQKPNPAQWSKKTVKGTPKRGIIILGLPYFETHQIQITKQGNRREGKWRKANHRPFRDGVCLGAVSACELASACCQGTTTFVGVHLAGACGFRASRSLFWQNCFSLPPVSMSGPKPTFLPFGVSGYHLLNKWLILGASWGDV